MSKAPGPGDGQPTPASPAARAPGSERPPSAPPRAPEARGLRRTFAALRNRDFRYLWTGTMFMWCAGQFQSIGQGYLAYELTGSAGLLGVISIGYGLPMIALALFGGAIADRMQRKRLIQLFQAAEALIALALAVSVVTETVTWYHILVASTIHGALFAFMLPARQAIIPELVDRSEITNAIGLNSAGQSAIMLTAPAISGGLYELFGPAAVFMGMFVLQVAAVVLTGFVPSTRRASSRPSKDVLLDVKEGLVVIGQNRVVMVLLSMALVSTLVMMPFTQLLPVFVVEIYNREAGSLGLMSAIMGIGSLPGSLFVAYVGSHRRGIMLLATSFMSGATLLLMASFPYYAAGAAIMLFMGLGASPQRALKESLAMDAVDDRYRGRVMSVLMLSIGLVPLGVLPLGLAADNLGARATLVIMGGTITAMTLIVLMTQRALREAH